MITKMFSESDKDGDGFLSKDEIGPMLQSTASTSTSGVDADAFFAKLDKNGDGSISKPEAIEFFSKMMQMVQEGRVGQKQAMEKEEL